MEVSFSGALLQHAMDDFCREAASCWSCIAKYTIYFVSIPRITVPVTFLRESSEILASCHVFYPPHVKRQLSFPVMHNGECPRRTNI